MWLDNLKAVKAERKLSTKQVAEKANLAERTVTRIFSGETANPSMDYMLKIARALECSLDDIFADTQAVVGRSNLATLQAEVENLTGELERVNGELALMGAENAVLNSKVNTLTSENELLRLKLEHKEELIALHNYYIKLKASE